MIIGVSKTIIHTWRNRHETCADNMLVYVWPVVQAFAEQALVAGGLYTRHCRIFP